MFYTHKSSISPSLYGFLTSFVFFAAGCVSGPQIDNDIIETEAVYFEPIGQGSSADFSTVTEEMVYNAESWSEYQQYMETVLPFHDVDFSQLMVAFVAVPAHTGGVTVQIESAEIAGEELVISYVIGEPGDDCRVMDIPSVPFQAVTMRQIDMPIRFEHREEAQACTLR